MKGNKLTKPGWPQAAIDFIQLYAHVEGSLKNASLLRINRRHAEADWSKLASFLSADFFAKIQKSQKATDLVSEPPRRRMSEDFAWHPEQQTPIQNTEELFRRGICQVRHNLAHGEKFSVSGDGWERDEKLVTQSLWVLENVVEDSDFLAKTTRTARKK